MATKTIYLEKETEIILNSFARENNLTVSKAINLIIQGKTNETKKTPLKAPKQVETSKNLTFAQILQSKRQKNKTQKKG